MGFITEIVKFLSEILKLNNNTATVLVILSFVLIAFCIKHIIKVFTKSMFDNCFLTKEQLIRHKLLRFIYIFGLFNITCILWAWGVSSTLDINNLPVFVKWIFWAANWFFIINLFIVLGSVLYRYYQKFRAITLSSRSEWVYNKVVNSSLISIYFIYILILLIYFSTRNTTASYWSFLSDIGMFLFFSFIVFIIYGFYLFDHLGISDPTRYSIVLKKENINSQLYVLHSLDSKNLVLGNKPTEKESVNLFLYNLEKDTLLNFEIKIINPSELPEPTTDTLPKRKERHLKK